MLLAVIIEAVFISAFFNQQERRHRFELEIEYGKLGRKMPVDPPKLPMLESIANIVVGFILAEIGGSSLWAFFHFLGDPRNTPMKFHLWRQMVVAEVIMLAGGIALMMLGIRSVRANLKFRKVGVPPTNFVED